MKADYRNAIIAAAMRSSPTVIKLLVRLLPQARQLKSRTLARTLVRESAVRRKTGSRGEAPRLVGFAMALMGLSSRRPVVRALHSAVVRLERQPETFHEQSQSVAEAVRLTPTRELEADEWEHLMAAFAAHGLITASLEARTHCRTRDGDGSRGERLSVLARLDHEGPESGSDLWRRAEYLGDPVILAYLGLLQDSSVTNDLAPERLRTMVEGRRVALVGSAVIREAHGRDIDSHDVVARLKYAGPQYLQPPELVGRKTTIALHNKAMARIINTHLDTPESGPPPTIDSSILVLGKRLIHGLGSNYHQLLRRCPTYLSPSSLGVQAVLQLLVAHPRNLSVFGMDFYLADQPHYPGDLNERDRAARGAIRDNAHYCLAFAQHDPFSQIRFVRHLAEAGAITPYGRTAEVLAMTDLEYAKGLEARYGRWDRP